MIKQLQQGWTHPGWRNWLLLPVSLIYGVLMQLRTHCYQLGICKSYKAKVPIIVVGNLSVGGTGKTPLVKAIVNHLTEQGWQPGIITRGYGAQSLTGSRLVTTDDSPLAVGDEPLMLRQTSDVPVAIGANRIQSVDLLIEQCECNIIVSDDGFQHHALKRDIDIVVIDGQAGFSNGWCLPSGPLREFQGALKRADMVVANSAQKSLPAGQFEMKVQGDELVNLTTPTDRQPLTNLIGKSVHAVAGLGNPQRFFNALEQAELDITRHPFSDHHRYTAADFEFATNADHLVMTEKDAVKCRELALPENTWVLPISAMVTPDFFQVLNDKLKNRP